MILCLLRHTDALDGFDDEKRPLSPQGHAEAKALGQFLVQAKMSFKAAYSSPLLRAYETALAVLRECNPSLVEAVQLDPALRNETPQDAFDRWLAQLPDVAPVLLVGHAPTIAARSRKLLGIQQPTSLEFPKGGLACIKTKNRRDGFLLFYISPQLLSCS